MPYPQALRALNHRDYRLFWSGQVLSLVGTWMQSLGQAWLVLELTGSPFRLGLIGALQFAPILALAMVTGAVTDRLPKRPLVVLTQVALMAAALTLAALAWSGHLDYWHVAVLAGFVGVVNALDMPARQSLVAELVPPDDLVNAIALNSAVFNGARIVGPAVGGLLIGRYGVALAFLLNGLSFVAVIGALAAMRPAPALPRPRAGTTLVAEIADGLRYVAASAPIAVVLSVLLVVSLFTLNHSVLVPVVARDMLRLDVQGLGFLMAALGAGAVSGAVGVAVLVSGRPPMSLVLAPAVVIGAALFALTFAHRVAPAAALLFVIGAAQIVFLTSANTTVQLTVPAELRGRIMSLYMLVFAGMSPFGSLLIGSLAENLGASAACAVGGGLGLVSVLLLTLRWLRREAAQRAVR
jgi:MFS family permease